jgi:hypothetical protein
MVFRVAMAVHVPVALAGLVGMAIASRRVREAARPRAVEPSSAAIR